MYTPRQFVETREPVLHRIVEENGFATLISVQDGAPVLSHLPFLLEKDGDRTKLVAHMARANPHWEIFAENPRVLVAFHGPHAYISPGWYPPAPTNVPTWNYVALHAHGTARVVEDLEKKREALATLVRRSEARYGTGWKLDPEGTESLLSAIVMFEVAVERLEGKLKLSQHHAPESRRNVGEALTTSQDSVVRATGEWMLETLGR